MERKTELQLDMEAKPGPTLKLLDLDHCPFNKYRWEAKGSTCTLEVVDYDGTRSNPEAWTSIALTETVLNKLGNATSRTISMTLTPEARLALIQALTGGRG